MQTQENTTDTNGIFRRPPLQPGETLLYASELKSATNWSGVACALIGLVILTLAILMDTELHKARLDLESVKDRIDVTTGSVRDLAHAINPKVDHAICPAQVSHLDHEVDLGEAFPCPNPDVQGPLCVKTTAGEIITAEAFKTRCAAGKL